MNALTLTPGSLTLKQLRNVWRKPVTLSLDASAHAAINDSVACVEAIVAEGRTAYGINTGFGLLAQTRIATHDLENLQRSLVLSHAAGVGQPLDDEIQVVLVYGEDVPRVLELCAQVGIAAAPSLEALKVAVHV